MSTALAQGRVPVKNGGPKTKLIQSVVIRSEKNQDTENSEELDNLLKASIGKIVDITIVHHVEGHHLRTTGKLLEVTDQIIKLEIKYKNHFYSLKEKKMTYVCNRKMCSLLSLTIEENEN